MGKAAAIGAMAALAMAGDAGAQRVVQPGPGVGNPPAAPNDYYPPIPPAPVRPLPGQRWGGAVSGRWWGGTQAPGGWAAYRAPFRGYRLPVYWLAPRFRLPDWQAYDLPQPPSGYLWTRYYDDAVLIDGRGDVFDTVGGVDWDRSDSGYRVGAPGGYALDSSGDSRRGAPLPPSIAYGAPGAGYGEPSPPPPRRDGRWPDDRGPGPGYPPRWVSPDGRTTVTVTTSGGAGPVAYAPAHGGGGTTTVTVQVAPVVTTVTTEIVEDSVTWTRPVVRTIHKKRAWRPVRKTKLLMRH